MIAKRRLLHSQLSYDSKDISANNTNWIEQLYFVALDEQSTIVLHHARARRDVED